LTLRVTAPGLPPSRGPGRPRRELPSLLDRPAARSRRGPCRELGCDHRAETSRSSNSRVVIGGRAAPGGVAAPAPRLPRRHPPRRSRSRSRPGRWPSSDRDLVSDSGSPCSRATTGRPRPGQGRLPAPADRGPDDLHTSGAAAEARAASRGAGSEGYSPDAPRPQASSTKRWRPRTTRAPLRRGPGGQPGGHLEFETDRCRIPTCHDYIVVGKGSHCPGGNT